MVGVFMAHVAMTECSNMQVRCATKFKNSSSIELGMLTSDFLDSNRAVDTAGGCVGNVVVCRAEVYLSRLLERAKETALAAL